jgi:hypothetical protein
MFLEAGVHPDTVTRLKLFRERFESLKGSKLLSHGAVPNRVEMSFNRERGPQFTGEFPDDEELHYFASRIRPFTLKDDDVGFRRICTLGIKATSEDSLKVWFGLALVEYDAIRANPDCSSGVMLYDRGGKFLSPGAIFDLYMYSDVQHVKLDVHKELEALHEGKLIARSTFVAVCLSLMLGPFQVVADTIGIMLGELPMVPAAQVGPPKERLRMAETLKQEGKLFETVPYDQLSRKLVAFWPITYEPGSAPKPFEVWIAPVRPTAGAEPEDRTTPEDP